MEQLPLLPLSVKQNHPMKPARFYLPLALRSARSLEPGGLGQGVPVGSPACRMATQKQLLWCHSPTGTGSCEPGMGACPCLSPSPNGVTSCRF